MTIKEVISDRTLNQKGKVQTLGRLILDKKVIAQDIIDFAKKSGEAEMAICIESLEFATKQNPLLVNEKCLKFMTRSLTHDAPKVKREAARVIANIAHLFPSKLGKTIISLLDNTNHTGTVVRWSAALALGEILKLKTKYNTDLLPALEVLAKKEGDTGVKNKYLEAIRKVKKAG
jgi:hypothetical protein